MNISSSDEGLHTHPEIKPTAPQSVWERRSVNWCRLAEFEAALFCGLVALYLLLAADLSDTAIGHRWMLALGSEAAWIVVFALMSGVILTGAMTRPGVVRGACLLTGIWFFAALAAASIHAVSLVISSAAFVANACVLTVAFLRRRV